MYNFNLDSDSSNEYYYHIMRFPSEPSLLALEAVGAG
jgi:hypothetical protein